MRFLIKIAIKMVALRFALKHLALYKKQKNLAPF